MYTQKTKSFLILLLSSILVTACGEKESSNDTDTCVPSCQGKTAITCENDTEKPVDCKFGCDKGSCIGDPSKPDSCKPSCTNSTQTTCDADGSPKTQPCDYGCDGVICAKKPNDTECTPSCTNSTQTTCNPDGSKNTKPCDYGCDGIVCADEPGDTECTPSCSNSTQTTCNPDGSKNTNHCDYGCDGIVCANKPGACTGVTCKNNGSCDRGICVSTQMAGMQEGDSCDKWFQGYCDGDTKVTCVGGKITTSDCSDVHGCAMSKVKQYGETYLIPTCRKDGASCESGSTGYCVLENNGGTSEAHAYGLTCWDNTDDTMSGDKGDGSYLLCAANGCNPQKTSCWNKCDGNVLNMYNNSNLNCAGINQICVSEEQNGFCADACGQKDEVFNSCENNIERIRECRADDNGKLYYADTRAFPCDHGCDSSTGKCKKLVPDEYTDCDWNTFTQRCESNGIRVACVEGIVRAERCSEDNDKICGVVQNAATCFKPCTGTVTKSCDGNTLVTQTCAQNDAGILVPVSVETETCPYSCDAENKECNCSKGGYWCEDNAITHCDFDTKSVVKESCGTEICKAWSDGTECYKKQYSTANDCKNELENLKCENGDHVTSHVCDYPISGSGPAYGTWETEHCEYGCGSTDDRCCEFNEKYNSATETCDCDTANGWNPLNTASGKYCVCKGGECSAFKVGSYLSLGGKSLDNAIIWRVLKVDESQRRLFIIYDEFINIEFPSAQFSTNANITTWDKSYVRTYLNTTAAGEGWQREESLLTVIKNRAVTTTVHTPSYSGNSGGADTEDKIFLLSYDEAETFNAGSGKLRSPGEERGTVMYRNVMWSGGSSPSVTVKYEDSSPTAYGSFTPAMWITY